MYGQLDHTSGVFDPRKALMKKLLVIGALLFVAQHSFNAYSAFSIAKGSLTKIMTVHKAALN